AHLLLLPADDAALRLHVPVPRHAGMGAVGRQRAADHLLPAHGARHPAQGKRLGRAVAECLAAPRLHRGDDDHRHPLLPPDARLMRRSLLSVFLLGGCSSHEPLKPPPETPAPAQYTPTPVAEERLAPGKDIPADWWALFQSPALDALVRKALDNS